MCEVCLCIEVRCRRCGAHCASLSVFDVKIGTTGSLVAPILLSVSALRVHTASRPLARHLQAWLMKARPAAAKRAAARAKAKADALEAVDLPRQFTNRELDLTSLV